MKTSVRYWLFQIPGNLAVAGLVTLAWWMGWITPEIAVGVVVLAILKDVLMYPLVRKSYETNAKTGVVKLIGETGIVVHKLEPEGYIRIRGELWRSRMLQAGEIPANAQVTVKGFEGMVLVVEQE